MTHCALINLKVIDDTLCSHRSTLLRTNKNKHTFVLVSEMLLIKRVTIFHAPPDLRDVASKRRIVGLERKASARLPFAV